MTEYQYYEFLAIDRPLDADELDAVRSTSSRARITPVSFVNEYQWSDYRGDPNKLMERFYDAHLYVSNWGSRRFMLRLPVGVLDADLDPYSDYDTLFHRRTDTSLILDFVSDDDEGSNEDFADPAGLLASLIGVRDELAAGDLRPLYLAWLSGVWLWMADDEDAAVMLEPPVPAGLGTLSASQQTLADFLRVDPDLLCVAASASSPRIADADDPDDLADWLAELPAVDKDRLLFRVINGESGGVRTELLRAFRSAAHDAPTQTSTARRTVQELAASASDLRAEAQRQAAAKKRARRMRREQAEARAYGERLDQLAHDESGAWSHVDELISTVKTSEYATAVGVLTDLRALADRDGRLTTFDPRVAALRQTHRRKRNLIERLDKAGF